MDIVDIKKLKNVAKKTYKNIPKNQLVKKAGTFAFKQLFGGPYLNVASMIFGQTKDKLVSYAGTYAYENFARSRYARDKINAIPMFLVATVVKIIINFLIISRLKTGNHYFDFSVSIIITIVTTLLSPIFYTSVKAHEDSFMLYTNKFVDVILGPGGWERVETTKNRILFIVAVIIIGILEIIEINSRFIQEFIIHSLITGFFTDQLQRWFISQPYRDVRFISMTNIEPVEPQIIIPINYNVRKIKRCNTKHIIIKGLKPIQAKIVSI